MQDRGLRKRLAKRVAKGAQEERTDGKPPAVLREVAEDLRRLAAEVESLGTGEHAEPQASARRAARPRRKPAAPKGDPATTRKRVRRS